MNYGPPQVIYLLTLQQFLRNQRRRAVSDHRWEAFTAFHNEIGCFLEMLTMLSDFYLIMRYSEIYKFSSSILSKTGIKKWQEVIFIYFHFYFQAPGQNNQTDGWKNVTDLLIL